MLVIKKHPEKEPISLEEAKLHRRIKFTAEDTLVTSCIESAREIAEGLTWKQYVLATVVQYFDDFTTTLELEKPPVREVVSVKYIDSAGDTQTVSSSNYTVDVVSGTVTVADGSTWPTPDNRANAVFVEYKSGHLIPVTVDTAGDSLDNSDHPFEDGDVVQVYVSGDNDRAAPAGLTLGKNYYVVNSDAEGVSLSATEGGSAIDITDSGTGEIFLGHLPKGDKAAMFLMIGHFYENREDVIVSNSSLSAVKIPEGAEKLLMRNSKRYL